MSGPPPNSNRQRTPQSPLNSSQPIPHLSSSQHPPASSSHLSLHATRLPPRPAPHTPRYYRSSGASGPSCSGSIGWTPRTAASPHALQRSYRPLPRSGSPRLKSVPSISKPVKPAPISVSPSAPNTPSWLKGTYKPQPPSAAPLSTVEQWCEHRISAIKATVDDTQTEGNVDDIPELRKVMTDLDSKSIPDEIQVLQGLRKDYWRAVERQKKAMSELRKAEREVMRIEPPAMHIESKISRLRRYAKFIESGWMDEDVLDITKSDNNGDIKSEDVPVKSEDELVPERDVKTEPVVKDGS
ncbi:unnamed protein product [Agarophyton chilense]|eukprot:gb/GEZJ01004118.1/.p1 GENE.gb/GEZJ01004118.1/~~gb/GEZJ01004118.1/.p1  ORF type:complete len:298 (-),score=43.12 gb/GEZJ01004118.1/:4273-5166(-)